MSRQKLTDWQEHVYPLTTHRSRFALPLTTVTDQQSWHANITNTIRREIRLLCCDEKTFVEGVKVCRTGAFSKQTYMVQRDGVLYTLDGAVARVIEIITQREKRNIK